MPMTPKFKFLSLTSPPCSRLTWLNVHMTILLRCLRDISHSIFFEGVTLDFPLTTCSTKPFPGFSISENDTIIIQLLKLKPRNHPWLLFPFLTAICNVPANSVDSISKYMLTLLLTPLRVPSWPKPPSSLFPVWHLESSHNPNARRLF